MIGLRCLVLALMPLALSACVVPDASHAGGPWSPQGLNAANLAAMVANPADLSHGHGDSGPERKLSARAVHDLWTNPAAPLAQDAASSGGTSAGAGQSAPSAGSGGGSGTTGSGS